MTLTRPGHRLLALGVALALGLAAIAFEMVLVAQRVGASGAHPVPASAGHVETATLSFPPDTTYCLTHIGIHCYQPAQFQAAYDLQPLYNKGRNGKGSTIVIVDAFGSPTIQADLQHFDATFGLPDPPSFQIIQPAGAVPAYPADPFGAGDRSGWAVETTLDVEWSHVIAPGANILLVETPASETEGVQGFPEIVAAENYVINHNMGDVISQSFGATENTFPSKDALLDLRSAFKNASRHHVAVLAGSGDEGATNIQSDLSSLYPFPVNSWPSSDPLVTSLGGTQLNLDLSGNRLAPDVVWNDGRGASGGGKSQVFERPEFQNSVKSVTGDMRGTPDISMSAAVDGGVDFYYSFCDYNRVDPGTGTPPLCGPQWHIVGGTSEASPLFAGVVAIADQIAGHRIGQLNSRLYELARHSAKNGIVDVTSGNNSFAGVTGYPAGPGYDLASGLGTVDVATFAPALAHTEGE